MDLPPSKSPKYLIDQLPIEQPIRLASCYISCSLKLIPSKILFAILILKLEARYQNNRIWTILFYEKQCVISEMKMTNFNQLPSYHKPCKEALDLCLHYHSSLAISHNTKKEGKKEGRDRVTLSQAFGPFEFTSWSPIYYN